MSLFVFCGRFPYTSSSRAKYILYIIVRMTSWLEHTPALYADLNCFVEVTLPRWWCRAMWYVLWDCESQSPPWLSIVDNTYSDPSSKR